jgi:2-keto-4-pentenoate hydratase
MSIHNLRIRWTRHGNVVVLADHHRGEAITQHPASAIEKLAAELNDRGVVIDRVQIIYQDASGQWHGMITKKGTFDYSVRLSTGGLIEQQAIGLTLLLGWPPTP